MFKRNFFSKINLVLVIIFISTLFVSATVAKVKKPVTVESSIAAEPSSEEITLGESEIVIPTATDVVTKAVQSVSISNSPTPPPSNENQLKFGIVVDDYANKYETISALEAKTGKKFSSVGIYKQFGHPTNKDLILSDLNFIKNNGKTLIVTWEPWNPLEGMNQSRDYLKEIAAGNENEYINKFLESVKTYGGKTVIRFGHEMNGNWYPWGQRPEDYKKAYIKIHEALKLQNVTNAALNWSINSENVPYEAIDGVSKYYPGDAYVDSISIDGYNWGTTQPATGWRTFTNIFTSSYNYISATYNKPLFIAETGSSEEGGNKSQWVSQMFVEINTKFKKINEVVWFNLLKETDWRMESTDSSLSAFKRHLTNTP